MGAPWEDPEGKAEGRKSAFLMSHLQSFADGYIINKISVPGTGNGPVLHGRARSSVGDCAAVVIPLDG